MNQRESITQVNNFILNILINKIIFHHGLLTDKSEIMNYFFHATHVERILTKIFFIPLAWLSLYSHFFKSTLNFSPETRIQSRFVQKVLEHSIERFPSSSIFWMKLFMHSDDYIGKSDSAFQPVRLSDFFIHEFTLQSQSRNFQLPGDFEWLSWALRSLFIWKICAIFVRDMWMEIRCRNYIASNKTQLFKLFDYLCFNWWKKILQYFHFNKLETP